MQPNPVLKKLGFSETDRVAIIHADDIGMCEASISAFADLDAFGLVSCGAVMVPCPWFLEAAAYARAHPQADLGVHLTLNSEWATYRWRPISTVDPRSGLVDEHGYLPRTSEEVWERGDARAVECEMEAQIEHTIHAGIQPTHADSHMATIACARFIAPYIRVAMAHRLPSIVLRMDEAGWRESGLDAESAALAAQMVCRLEEMGLPLIDHMAMMPLERHEERLEEAKHLIAGLRPGITHVLFHPSQDTPELRAITPDWRARVADYQTFQREELRAYIRSIGVHVIGYRALQALMPG